MVSGDPFEMKLLKREDAVFLFSARFANISLPTPGFQFFG